MTDVLVTARIPDSLISELRAQVKKQHYLDLSELIRSVLRKRFEEHANANPRRVTDSIIKDIKKHTVSSSESLLSDELLRLKKRLKEELK